MADLAKLRELESRLVEAEGASRELDALLWAALLPSHGEGIDGKGEPPAGACFEYEADERGGVSMYVMRDGQPVGNGKRAKRPAPRLTLSIDDALALIEEKLPKAGIDLYRFPEGVMEPQGWFAEIQPHGALGDSEGEDSEPAKALCIAFVRALIAQEEGSAREPVQEGESGEKEGQSK